MITWCDKKSLFFFVLRTGAEARPMVWVGTLIGWKLNFGGVAVGEASLGQG